MKVNENLKVQTVDFENLRYGEVFVTNELKGIFMVVETMYDNETGDKICNCVNLETGALIFCPDNIACIKKDACLT